MMRTVTAPNFGARFVCLDDLLDAYERTASAVGALADAVPPARMADPTPCADWDVRALLCHLTFVVHRYGQLAETGVALAEQLSYADPVLAFHTYAARAGAAFARPGYLDEVAGTPIGPQPGSVTVQHVINELMAHGWDLARATGADTDLVPDVARASLTSWRVLLGDGDRAGMPIGPPRPASPGASAADQLAAFLGRTLG